MRGLWPAPLALALLLAACSTTDPVAGDQPREVAVDVDQLAQPAPESQDECPGGQEISFSWDEDADRCPGSAETLVDFAVLDIGSYWASEMRNHGLPYSPPARLALYEESILTPCGPASGQAFYCPADGAIYYDVGLMQQQFDAAGPYGPVLILAHEWARLIQHQLAMAEAGLSDVELELQADCFAGAYTRRSTADNRYDGAGLGDAPAAVLGGGLTWTPFAAAASPEERVEWFGRGLENGVNYCLD